MDDEELLDQVLVPSTQEEDMTSFSKSLIVRLNLTGKTETVNSPNSKEHTIVIAFLAANLSYKNAQFCNLIKLQQSACYLQNTWHSERFCNPFLQNMLTFG